MTKTDSRHASRTRTAAHLALICLSILALLPLYLMISTSLKPLSEALLAPPTIIPKSFTLRSYIEIFSETMMARWIVNSLVVSSITASGNVVFGALAGYALARLKFRGSGIILGLVLMSFMIPFEATFIANFVLVTDIGWYNEYPALIVPWLAGAFAVFLFRQEFMGLPDDIFDSAYVDGCSEFRTFRSVALPLVAAPAITVFLLNFIWSWNSLLWPLFITSDSSLRVVQLGLLAFKTEGGIFVNLMMAAATLSMLPIAILFLATQRFVIEGITQGAVR